MPSRSMLVSFALGVVVAIAAAVTIRAHRDRGSEHGDGNATAAVYVARVADGAAQDTRERHDLETAELALASARQSMLSALAEHFAVRRRAGAAPAVVDDEPPATVAAAPDAAPPATPGRADVARPVATPGRAELTDEAPPALRMDGEWLVRNTVESTRDRASAGLRFDYRLRLRQQRGRVEGRGARVAKNGRPLSPGQQTPVSVTGTVDDRRVELRFAEHGRRSQREGRFTWNATSDTDRLDGRFASDAAATIGRSEAHRLAD